MKIENCERISRENGFPHWETNSSRLWILWQFSYQFRFDQSSPNIVGCSQVSASVIPMTLYFGRGENSFKEIPTESTGNFRANSYAFYSFTAILSLPKVNHSFSEDKRQFHIDKIRDN